MLLPLYRELLGPAGTIVLNVAAPVYVVDMGTEAVPHVFGSEAAMLNKPLRQLADAFKGSVVADDVSGKGR